MNTVEKNGIVPKPSKSVVYELDTLRSKGHECLETQIFSDSSFTGSMVRKTSTEQCQVAKGRFGTIPKKPLRVSGRAALSRDDD